MEETVEEHLIGAKIKVFYGTFIDTPFIGKLRVRQHTAVGVNENGTIVFIKENCESPDIALLEYNPDININDNVEFINKQCEKEYSTFFFPGFIDTHIHASQYPNSGIFGNTTLLDWLTKYTFPLEASLKDLSIAHKVYTKVVERTLSNGTTTAAYYTTIDPESTKLMAKICSERGQRALIGKVCMDRNSPDTYQESTHESLESSDEVIAYIRNTLKDPKILPILTPRFAPTCSCELMKGLSKLAQSYDNLHIQTHLSENLKEIDWVKELFPDCSSYTDVYYKYGLLTNKTILAHCVHLSNPEIELIKTAGAGVAHCPIANTSLSSGECHVRKLIDEGVNVGLGTDVSGGFSSSILVTARQAHLVSRHLSMKFEDEVDKDHMKLSVVDALYLGTQGGANVLNMGDKLGTFDVGKKFDSQLININSEYDPVDIFHWQVPSENNDSFTMEEIISKWFFNGDDRNTINVWVDGSQIL
ncbi:hypothetical protein Kpol_1054p46 [Vanderwaltozyma polyspora DSM 70294]|uniref:Guanine deaminase n=1 Tax=Vanderwaltozyma polyspora (strain ATCC 22028 / DSM 70294 / BCRC 21397 / CBS 2163 / NBRC 10782 / NRRL Y-8283 / UCD 57-17) TaxID=436907 RepID=A7TID3_VANPO|nr:uncharacterized protein Kpol_1054p46 [Vanderwaltozyma polyspora DSM 70294]EDO17999.1 hypothetical protein Kpol_1054p46 [Vanderwaltozyma polyspora DSM 70294]